MFTIPKEESDSFL